MFCHLYLKLVKNVCITDNPRIFLPSLPCLRDLFCDNFAIFVLCNAMCNHHDNYHNLTLRSRCRRRGNRTLSEPNVKLSPPLIWFLKMIIVLLMIMMMILMIMILMMIMNLNLTMSIQSGQGGVLPGERIILDHKI